ncbi:zinc-binding dehydrogenase [Williamsia sterculiae]|uniref:Threonine dehydrogenase n=1 Tax=Williamsia sterculiae TaxID=1344003 RepID=A0A1N7ENL2_9NOCA|nr:zinc-binding dehydrogenase [Williamsia sterculiae]SIR89505.1 Threonine dehydrogenase [Williamsia sterculiae]
MRAVVCAEGRLTVQELPTPTPGRGHVLLDVTRSGICGSDLHARRHADTVADMAARAGYPDFMRMNQGVVLGHEFVGTVAAYGPGCRERWPLGTRVVSLPTVAVDDKPHLVGLSAHAPGSYAEHVVVQEAMTMAVPDELDDADAALTEPMAVAWHAVRRAEVGRGQTAIVIGCGPIGLAVIAMLRASGVKTIVASDFSPGRRELATKMGAHVVVDPRVEDPWDAYSPGRNELRSVSDLLGLGVQTMGRLRRLPARFPWWRVFRLAERLHAVPEGPVVFECVGIPGMIEQIINAAPLRSRVVVVGVCMEPDTFFPAMAGNKEIDFRFVFGYDPGEFHDTLTMMANGRVDVSPLITGTVGLDGVAAAFDALSDPEAHAKILIDPRSSAETP